MGTEAKSRVWAAVYGDGAAPFEDEPMTLVREFEAPVSYDEALEDAEYQLGDSNFVLAVIATNDPDEAVELWRVERGGNDDKFQPG